MIVKSQVLCKICGKKLSKHQNDYCKFCDDNQKQLNLFNWFQDIDLGELICDCHKRNLIL